MRRVTLINLILGGLLATFASAHVTENVDGAADTLFNRALEVSPLIHADLDDSTLGKTGTLATAPRVNPFFAVAPRTSASLRSVASPSSSLNFGSPLAGHRREMYRPSLNAKATPNCHISILKADAPAIDAKVVKALREETGAGMMACKKALTENNGDVEKAKEYLKKKGLAAQEKRAGRGTGEGIIETYVHAGSKLAVMVELNCETDFVAKNPDFKALAKNIAMQIAATPNVEVVSEADVSPALLEREKKILMEKDDMKGKPPDIVEKMIAGRIGKIIKEKTLLDSPYIRDPNMNVETFIKSEGTKFGENVVVSRFARFALGQPAVVAGADDPAPAPAEPAAEGA